MLNYLYKKCDTTENNNGQSGLFVSANKEQQNFM